AGFGAAALSGEDNADEIRIGNDGRPVFLSNNAGGILGGISTGQPIVARFAVKPTSSILTPRRTVDRFGAETEISTKGRHDPCVAACLCTPENMAFIIRNTSGIVCAPLAPEQAKHLHLDPMVALNDAPLGTAFTVSVDVRHGLTTGISAEERSNTVRALAND